MRPISRRYRKNGYIYSQESREGDVAVYSQSNDDNTVVAYEVFRIRKLEEGELMGKHIQATERPPKNEEWGKDAYTVRTHAEALQRMRALVNKTQ